MDKAGLVFLVIGAVLTFGAKFFVRGEDGEEKTKKILIVKLIGLAAVVAAAVMVFMFK